MLAAGQGRLDEALAQLQQALRIAEEEGLSDLTAELARVMEQLR
jgi:predicted negative regulator of RcsB-dependent stress response